MTTKPYSELLAQVEALAGATLALQEQRRVKIFANRRAKDAHRECPYWPRFLRVGEERIVSESGLLPLTETGKETIDQIIRIHRQDPFKQREAFEYTEYYEDSTGIQITGYQKAEHTSIYGALTIGGINNPDITGSQLFVNGTFDAPVWTTDGNSGYPGSGTWATTIRLETSFGIQWSFNIFTNTGDPAGWNGEGYAEFPDGILSWTPTGDSSGTLTVTRADVYSAFVTYLAAPADTYGDGEGEEPNVPEEWFEYMAQGAYCDWLRSDGQTEKALAEEAIAAKLLGQQLEKVSRQNGNQVITRQLSHGNMQYR